MERILTRISLRSARPRDLTRLCDSLNALPAINTLLAQIEHPLIDSLHREIGVFPEQQDLLSRSLIDNPPMTVRDGGVIANGYDSELDELRALSTNASDFLLQLEQRERENRDQHLKSRV